MFQRHFEQKRDEHRENDFCVVPYKMDGVVAKVEHPLDGMKETRLSIKENSRTLRFKFSCLFCKLICV